jgi:branched-subunit amino acid ABC-type transport system permease component
MANEILFAFFNAAAFGMAIFLVAAGLTLIFGCCGCSTWRGAASS